MKCLKHCTVRMLIGDGEGQPIKGNIVGQQKMQTADCYRPLFLSRKREKDKNSPIVFFNFVVDTSNKLSWSHCHLLFNS